MSSCRRMWRLTYLTEEVNCGAAFNPFLLIEVCLIGSVFSIPLPCHISDGTSGYYFSKIIVLS